MVQAVGEDRVEGTRKQEKRDPPKTLSLKSEQPQNLFPKSDPPGKPSHKADPPDIIPPKADPGSKISQKKTKCVGKPHSALETNGVLYQKVSLPGQDKLLDKNLTKA